MCAKDLSPAQQPTIPDTEFADLVLRHTSDGIVISGPDRTALWVNTAFIAQSGYTLDDLRGKEPGSILQGPDTDRDTAAEIVAACHQRREIRTDILNYTARGTPFWVDLKISPVFDKDGRHTYFISTMRDISERKVLEQQNEVMRHSEELRQAERQLLALTSEWLYSAKSYDELLMVTQRAMHTLIPEADGALYIYASSRRMLELATAWGTMPDFPQHILPDDCWALRRGRAYAYGLKPIQFACDHVDKKGTPYFCLPIIAHGETIGLLHIIFDGFEEGGIMRHMREDVLRNRWDLSLICGEQISLAIANVRLRQELHDNSMRDALTGLWNRRWFLERASRDLAMAERAGKQVALIMLDVDNFKNFNDTYGHDAGDFVLKGVGRVLSEHNSETVQACRLGGEEFILLCSDSSLADATKIAEDARKKLSESAHAMYSDTPLPRVTGSFGIGLFPSHGTTLDEVMKAADQALYLAKHKGRNCTITADDLPRGENAVS